MNGSKKGLTVTITLLPEGKRIVARASANLLTVLLEHGCFHERSLCNGAGQCGGCQIVYDDGTTSRYVRACQIEVGDDCRVKIPARHEGLRILQQAAIDLSLADKPIYETISLTSMEAGTKADTWTALQQNLSNKVTADLPVLRRLSLAIQSREPFHILRTETEVVEVQIGPSLLPLCGVAVDVGTTTLVAYLYEMRNCRLLAVEADINPQTAIAADLISRINFAGSSPQGTEQLAQMLRQKMNELLDRLTAQAGLDNDCVQEVVIAGNTCMQHLLLGISPASLGQAPYVPFIASPLYCCSSMIGLQLKETARIYCMPVIGGFVGGDALATAVDCLAGAERKNWLVIDIGTNCEIILAASGKMYACSAAAGPAFEGGAVSQGMRAVAGAIDRVWLEADRVLVHVVDDIDPDGICGSGLVDAVSVMLQAGIIEASGRMLSRAEAEAAGMPVDWVGRLAVQNGVQVCFLAKNVAVTQQDVRQLQLAKAAIGVGIRILLDEAGMAAEELDVFFLAGAFGNYLSLDSAVQVGIVPQALKNRVRLAGNAAGAGASRVLLSQTARRQAEFWGRAAKHVNLADQPNFSTLYVQELSFPLGSDCRE